MENWKLVKVGYWVTGAGFDLKRTGTYPLSPSSLKILLKNTALEYVYYFHGQVSWPNVVWIERYI